ncbi:MAG: M81 family metallopeptidase [Chthoniobacter sp.]|uniref:M81 family metallopeptidase n=1 Tax=Chthoniobacter sp. TaxID=2510640 RepID=UPI0032A9A0B1
MSRPRVLFAGLFHETHTFLEGTTPLADFQVLCGCDLLRCTGDSSPLGGALASAKSFGWEIVPTVDFRASPSATVEDEVIESFWQELAARIPSQVDAVYLVLHGAMVSQSSLDVEGEILSRLRQRVGDVPIFGVFDLHANFTQRMADLANCLVAYRENPHTDGRAMAVLAAELLQRALTTQQVPRMFWHHPPIMWPPTGTATALPPMHVLEMLARQLEVESPAFWVVNVVAGFSFADTPDTGVSFAIATTDEESDPHGALQRLAALAHATRAAGNVTDAPVAEVLAKLDPLPSGLTVLVEPSDNIGGGAPGDGTSLLRALVERAIPNAAIAINDPAAVQRLSALAPGARINLPIGGKGSRIDAGPLDLEVELLHTGDGCFELEDKQSHLASMAGDCFDMGLCAVVRHAGRLTILLTSRKTPPFDLGQWRSQGIDPAQFSVIVVKAAVAHGRAYDPIATRMLWVDTPGPCTSNLRSLPYRHVRRPIFPLD